tara:strand:- start:188 stop:400 length:213 start_codon:yes stop_codon:yes gene_type:complete
MSPPKKRFVKEADNPEELAEMRAHWAMINDKTRLIKFKYQQFWDKNKGTWKRTFKGHQWFQETYEVQEDG